MSLGNVKRGDTPHKFNVIIEIPANAGTIKYEVDKDTQCLTVDRFMKTALQYPANYGYVPQTLCERYKDLDEGKWVKLDGYGDKAAAIAEIEDSIRIYNAQ